MLYWRTPLTSRWQGVNVTAAAAADAPQVMPIWEGYQEGWEDVTGMVSTPGTPSAPLALQRRGSK